MFKGILIGFILYAGSVEAQTPPLTLEAAVNRALEASPEVEQSAAALRRGELQAKLALSPFLPTLAVEGGMRNLGPEQDDESGRFAYGVAQYNLYNGGLDRAARAIRNTELARDRADLSLTKAKVTRNTIRRFAEVLYIDIAIKLNREAFEANKSQMLIARRKAAGGLTSNADVLEFEFRENALNTDLDLLRHERAVAARELNAVMGLEPSEVTLAGELTPEMAALAEQSQPTNEFLAQEALLIPRTELAVAELETRSAVATWLPKLNFEARYGDMVYAEPDVRNRPGWLLELRLTIPLFSGMETFYSRQTAAAREAEQASRLRRAELSLSQTVADREDKLKVLESLLKLQKENVVRSEKFFKATLEEYRRGVKNGPDVTSATEALFSARLRLQSLSKDVVMSRIGLIDLTSIEPK